MRNKKAFSLVEIIVVMIILGILACIALPNIFNWVERCKAEEAFANLGVYKNQLEVNYMMVPNYNSWTVDQSLIGSSTWWNYNYSYDMTGNNGMGSDPSSPARLYVKVLATRKTGTGTVALVRDPDNHSYSCKATGIYVGVC